MSDTTATLDIDQVAELYGCKPVTIRRMLAQKNRSLPAPMPRKAKQKIRWRTADIYRALGINTPEQATESAAQALLREIVRQELRAALPELLALNSRAVLS